MPLHVDVTSTMDGVRDAVGRDDGEDLDRQKSVEACRNKNGARIR